MDDMTITKPITVGKVELKNRIVMPPIIAAYQSSEEGKVTDKVLNYYGERAEGGNIGLIITEHLYISKQGKADKHQISISSDEDVAGLKKLVEVIKQNGTKVVAQINHAGSAAPSKVTGRVAVAPSSVELPITPMMGDGTKPNALSEEEIADVVKQFAESARRAKVAGFDGVEIHSAHGCLLNQFYSPLTNLRKDSYGGSLEKRLKIHMEVINAVRNAVGKDYMISIRLGGCDYREGGSTIADSVYACKMFEKAGVDLLNITGGMCLFMKPNHTEPGYFSDMSSAIKKEVHTPVILTGGVKSLVEAQRLIDKGSADLIGVGRELLKNPHWADEQIIIFKQ